VFFAINVEKEYELKTDPYTATNILY